MTIPEDILPWPPELDPIRDHLGWGLDLCQNAVFTPVIRPREHYPEPGAEGSIGFKPGFFELRSAHPIRATEAFDQDFGGVPPWQQELSSEVCRFHYGKMGAGIDGFARPTFCTQPRRGSNTDKRTRQTAVLHAYVQKGPDARGLVKPGFCAFVGAYHAPFWTEALLSSGGQICLAGAE